MVWTDTHAAAWALRERLKSSDLTNYLHNLLRDQAPRFIDGSTHTPVGEVKVLGTVGMRIETLRGLIRFTPDGDTNPAQLTIGAVGDPDVVIGNGNVLAEGISYSPTIDIQQTLPLSGITTAAGWTQAFAISGTPTPFGPHITQNDTSGASDALISVPRIQRGATIKTIGFLLDGNAGGNNHVSLPATMPLISLIRVDASTRAPTVVGSVTDASANVTDYQTLHWTDRAGNLGHVVVAGDEYYLRISGETGANAVNTALRVYSVRLTYAVGNVV